MFRFLLTFLWVLLAASSTKTLFAAIAPFPDFLKEVISKYQKSESVRIEFQKVQKSALLESEKRFEGEIKIREKKFLVSMDSFMKSKDVFLWTGKKFYLENRNRAGKVTSFISGDSINTPAFLLSLLFQKEAWKSVTIFKEEAPKKNKKIYHLKSSEKLEGVTGVKIALDTKNKKITSISYLDQLQNEITFVIKITDLDAKIEAKIFDYRPPKEVKLLKL